MPLSDILILVLLGILGIRGLFNGLIMEVFSLLGLLLGLIVSYKYYSLLSNILIKFDISESYAKSISYVVTFLAVYICIIILAKFLSKFFKVIRLGWADRTGGFLFGVFKGAILLGVVLTLVLSHISSESEFIKGIKKAPITDYILNTTPKFFKYLSKISDGKKEYPFKQVI